MREDDAPTLGESMFLRSQTECDELAKGFGFVADAKSNRIDRAPPFPYSLALSFSNARDRCHPLANALLAWCGGFEHAVLWVTEFGIWPSSENLHLYYAVRRSYGDTRAIWEAPGHEFLKHEHTDLVTFLDIALQFGWGCLLFGPPQRASLIVSHDEWVQFGSEENLREVASDAEKFGLKLINRRR